MLLQRFIPSLHLHTIFDIDFQKLRARGVRGIITNLDNTLIEQDSLHATERLMKWIQTLRQAGLKVVIVSNNRKVRVSEFARPLGIPFVYEARKPWGHPFERALRLLHTSSQETVVIGDQLLTDIYGGNKFGFFTVWVDPLHGKEGWPTRINRFFERILYRYLKNKGYMPWDEHL
ncbi:YqeG family HAD IIIA-type phosphatase [Tumebacillus permanentifrigoris]|uniref:YqeG family HAD IIIA-type phosphatase n=1 Tax=Tumebacillus permanentifrigoris TaxID=378543 RepID=A0A316DDD0_9BACL|nr:YqeG family HAD IIIA-type phosphatase [Tumebacillus permanentifrigoris]PWK16014.1 hypothetical protein C7459_102260 [Tumebacillus permanentifrigoris]